MSALRAWLSRLVEPFLGRRREARLAEELQAHLDLLADDFAARGLSRDDAQSAARRALGGVAQVTATHREQRGLPFLPTLALDIRFALRVLVRDRRFTTTAVLVLGLGLAVNTTLFTIFNGICLRGLPIPDPGRVLHVSTVDKDRGERGVSYLDFQEIRAGATGFEGVAAFAEAPLVLVERGHSPERVPSAYVSGEAFSLLREPALLGRTLTPADDRPGAPAVALMGSRLAKSRYGTGRAALGRTVHFGDRDAVIVGVMREGLAFPGSGDVWLPLSLMPGLAGMPRDARTLGVFGRVGGASPDAAQARIEAIVGRVSRAHPETSAGIRARVVPINARYTGRATDPTWLVFLTVGAMVVLIACANVANLMLAWSAGRGREMAIRGALGASHWRLVRQLLTESALLAVLGSGVGLLMALFFLRLFDSALPEGALPPWMMPAIDGRVLLSLTTATVATLFVFGVAPALHVSRSDVTRALKDGSRTATARGARRWTAAFLAVQFALTMVLLAHVVLSVRAGRPPVEGDLLVERSGALTAWIELEGPRHAEEGRNAPFFDRLFARLRAAGAVSVVAVATALPLHGGTDRGLEVEGRSGAASESVSTVAVSPEYFDALGLPLLRGRTFSPDEGGPGREAAVVNRRFVDVHFPDREPIGRTIRLTAPGTPPGAGTWLTIVGVSPTVRQHRGPDAAPVVYVPYRAMPAATAMVVLRSAGDPATTIAALRREVAALDPDLPIFRVMSMQQVFDDVQWNGRVSHGLIVAITGVAFVLALFGLYAVIAHGVSLRAQEIAIRMALGARPGQVRRQVVRGALPYIALGLGLGLACTAAWDAVLYSGQPGLRVSDWRVLVPAAALLGAVALAASLLPAMRAARLDPLSVIRDAG